MRGRYDSDGVWEVYVEAEDGHDTVEWIGSQPWCDGNVGMCGISYVGFTQMHPAVLGSEYLKGILPMGATPDGWTLFWQQGAFLSATGHPLDAGRSANESSTGNGSVWLVCLRGHAMVWVAPRSVNPPATSITCTGGLPLLTALGRVRRRSKLAVARVLDSSILR